MSPPGPASDGPLLQREAEERAGGGGCNIEVIGEAAKGVSSATRAAHPEIPWAKISGTHDQVIEEYFRVGLDISCGRSSRRNSLTCESR